MFAFLECHEAWAIHRNDARVGIELSARYLDGGVGITEGIMRVVEFNAIEFAEGVELSRTAPGGTKDAVNDVDVEHWALPADVMKPLAEVPTELGVDDAEVERDVHSNQ